MDGPTRVQDAIEGRVADAVKLLDEARRADTEARLMMLINGWGRGPAAGLEELAVAIDHARRADSPGPTPHVVRDEADAGSAPVQEPVELVLDAQARRETSTGRLGRAPAGGEAAPSRA